MKLAKYKACICEGSAESAIMDILLDDGLLIFSREEMIEEEVTIILIEIWKYAYRNVDAF